MRAALQLHYVVKARRQCTSRTLPSDSSHSCPSRLQVVGAQPYTSGNCIVLGAYTDAKEANLMAAQHLQFILGHVNGLQPTAELSSDSGSEEEWEELDVHAASRAAMCAAAAAAAATETQLREGFEMMKGSPGVITTTRTAAGAWGQYAAVAVHADDVLLYTPWVWVEPLYFGNTSEAVMAAEIHTLSDVSTEQPGHDHGCRLLETVRKAGAYVSQLLCNDLSVHLLGPLVDCLQHHPTAADDALPKRNHARTASVTC